MGIDRALACCRFLSRAPAVPSVGTDALTAFAAVAMSAAWAAALRWPARSGRCRHRPLAAVALHLDGRWLPVMPHGRPGASSSFFVHPGSERSAWV